MIGVGPNYLPRSGLVQYNSLLQFDAYFFEDLRRWAFLMEAIKSFCVAEPTPKLVWTEPRVTHMGFSDC
jgi:hypothetical protein